MFRKPILSMVGLLILLLLPLVTAASMSAVPWAFWRSSGPPGGDAPVVALSPSYETDGRLWSATSVGIYRSDDAGQTWQLVKPPPPSSDWKPASLVLSPHYPTDPTLFVAWDSDSPTHDARLWRSTDDGTAWTELWITEDLVDLVISPDYDHDATLFAAGQGAIVSKSTDGGASWFAVNAGIDPTFNPFRLAISPAYSGAYPAPRERDSSDQTLYLTGFGGLYRSTDGGANWQSLSAHGPNYGIAISPDFATDNTLFVTYREIEASGIYPESGVLRSTDRGDTWELVSAGLPGYYEPFPYALALSANFARDSILYVADGGTAFMDRRRVYRSFNRGKTWIEIPSMPGDLATRRLTTSHNGRALHAATEGGIWHFDGEACQERVANASFEGDYAWRMPVTAYSARYSSDQAHSGVRSMRAGIPPGQPDRYSYSSGYQTVTIPNDATSVHLRFWLWPATAESSTRRLPAVQGNPLLADLGSDVQYVLLLNENGGWIRTLLWQRSNARTWTYHEFNLSAYRGRTLRLHFGVFNDGAHGSTAMYVDEVSLEVCRPPVQPPPLQTPGAYLPLAMNNSTFPTPLPTATPSPTATATETMPTATPSPTTTMMLTLTPTLTSTATATPTSTPTPSPTTIVTETVTPTPTLTPTATETPTPSPTSTATETVTPTASPTEAIPTETPTASPSPSPTGEATSTPTPSPTELILTGTPTPTQTATQTITATVTETLTATPTSSPTSTATPTATPTSTATETPTSTTTSTPSPTPTATTTPSDIIVDDEDPEFTRHGTSIYWHSADSGWLGHHWWTYSNGNSVDNYARWRPDLPQSGTWEVSVYIPDAHATTRGARYEVYHRDGDNTVTVDQSSHPSSWLSLGQFPFDAGTAGYLRLTDATGESPGARQIAFDAARWAYRGPLPTPTPPVGGLDVNGGWGLRFVGHPSVLPFYAYTPDGLYRTLDDVNWELRNTVPPLDDFVMSPSDVNVLYGGQGYPCYLGGPSVPSFKSSDGGVTWFDMPAGINLAPLVVHPGDPSRVYASGCTGPHLTTDGGASWTLQFDSLFYVYDVAWIAPAPSNDWQTVYIAGVSEGGSGAIIKSTDGGASWAQSTPLTPTTEIWWISALVVDPQDADHVLFADPHGVWRTTDGGTHWQFSDMGLDDVVYDPNVPGRSYGLLSLALDPAVAGRLFLGTIRGLYVSTDGGASWSKLSGNPWDSDPIVRLLLRSPAPQHLLLQTDLGVYVFDLTYAIQ
ncbi:MAG TPA: hypothetical protein EYH31_06160 [Anaerolineae bacterium]|nr:hypothetical protein [Anaerolineae bacterium]